MWRDIRNWNDIKDVEGRKDHGDWRIKRFMNDLEHLLKTAVARRQWKAGTARRAVRDGLGETAFPKIRRPA
jgi:hypothetical protein